MLCGRVSILSDPMVWYNLLTELERSPSNFLIKLERSPNLVYHNAPTGALSCLVVANHIPAFSDIFLPFSQCHGGRIK